MATKVKKSELELLGKIERAYNKMPENARVEEILQMLANVIGEPLETIRERYIQIKTT